MSHFLEQLPCLKTTHGYFLIFQNSYLSLNIFAWVLLFKGRFFLLKIMLATKNAVLSIVISNGCQHNLNLMEKSLFVNYFLCVEPYTFFIFKNNAYSFTLAVWIVSVVWLTNERRLAFFPGIIIRYAHHHESNKQDLNMHRMWA